MAGKAQEIDKSVKYHDFINIDREFRKKSGKVYPFIPKFIIRYLEKKVHQEKLNYALHVYKDKLDFDFLDVVLNDEFGLNIQVANPENIPSSGRYIIASNHPLGGLDGMALMYVIGQKRKDLKFIVNDLLTGLVNLVGLFAPINKHGKTSSEGIRMIEELYESEELVLIFPAGLVSRKQKGGIKDLEWKKSFIAKSIQHKRDIIPVHIDGQNSKFFYNLARLRKFLGIKTNIEMFLLPDEMFKQENKIINIKFGKPIPYTTFTKEYSHIEWAQIVKEHVYKMNDGNEEFVAPVKNKK
ncbi:MAG: 1-acyl-sn-glycerol-3-phosphate acyltransferase [Ignavibacterium sp.]|nr:1-acyl-sn-glycerol-3-phosphate acyltransferase [Ignavibacterium sp.]